jgi:hypothetical protein
MNGSDDGFCVVFVEAWPHRSNVLRAHALLNAGQGLRMSIHSACDDSIKGDALRMPMLT